ncbi:MAG TPA: hypothetical protein VMN79_10870 [Casimicrobiaceae bacterium]|nr:hypothetical protein [Casimicrobiaceae bacterium]
MSSFAELAARKQLLVAELDLQRMQMSLHAGQARAALRPAGMLGGAIARPAATIALVDAVAPLFGFTRLARVVRLAALALAAYRIARVWRSRTPGPPPPA